MLNKIKKSVVYSWDKIRELVGFLTLPQDAEYSEFKEFWLPVQHIDLPRYVVEEDGKNIFFPYNYQGLEQNWLGIWKVNDMYLRKYSPVEQY